MRASAVLISACALIAAPTLALADPTGTYNVVGRNANDGSTYKGTAQVSRTGTTYKVVWLIAGKQSVGTGLGTHLENDGKTIVTGPATDRDIGLSVGYLSLVERDFATPSIKSLHAVSRALGVTVGWFFETGDAPEAERDLIVQRARRRRLEYSAGMLDELLSPI